MNVMVRFAGVLLLAAAGVALAQGEARLISAPSLSGFERDASLQRGARNFANYCLNCHSAQYMRYNRLTDLGLTLAHDCDEPEVELEMADRLLALAQEQRLPMWWVIAFVLTFMIGGLTGVMLASMQVDLQLHDTFFVVAHLHHVLWSLSGEKKLVDIEYENRDKAEAAAVAAKGLVLVEPAVGGKYFVKTLAEGTPGSLTSVEYERFASDLVNYLDYISEPVKDDRINIGIVVLIFLGVLFALVYALKRDYWKELH